MTSQWGPEALEKTLIEMILAIGLPASRTVGSCIGRAGSDCRGCGYLWKESSAGIQEIWILIWTVPNN